MTATTNGASLEDCLTNIFSLIDLNGLRWKRFKHKESHANILQTPIDTHPILTTYAKCIQENHIAVWRLEPQKRLSHGQGGSASGHGNAPGSTSHSNFPTPTRTSNNNTPTSGAPAHLNTSSGNLNGSSSAGSQLNYELWIFGYGNQLKVDNVITDELVEVEDETWESKGMSYDCRTLLFKALHNLIEQCLTSKGFTKLGRWFVRPSEDNKVNGMSTATSQHFTQQSTRNMFRDSHNGDDSKNLYSKISSTLEEIIECRRQVFESHNQCLNDSNSLRHTSSRSSNTYFTSSLDGSKLSLAFAFSFFVHGDSSVCATVDVRQHHLVHPISRSDLNAFQDGRIVRVALAPYGLNGVLNGVNYKDCDNGAATISFIQQWSKFYPLPKTTSRLIAVNKTPSSSNSAMNSSSNNQSSHKSSSDSNNHYNQSTASDPNSRAYLSNLTNMLLPPSQQKPGMFFDLEQNEVPPVIEVIVAGYRMRYPSECVFTTSKSVDLYKLASGTSLSRATTSITNKRSNKFSFSRPNKLSLLSERLSEDKNEAQAKIKTELGAVTMSTGVTTNTDKAQDSVFNSPFRLTTTTSTKANAKPSDEPSSKVDNQSKEKQSNGDVDSSITPNPITSMSRFNSKVGYTSIYTPLGPTDLVKLFPTPPSLEAIAPSPSCDELNNKDNISTLSPQNQDATKDNSIDVYKPAEYALMPPPPKWAALTNVVISNTKSLPPECIYKGSSQNTTSKIAKFINVESSRKNTRKELSSLLNKSSLLSSPAPSPFADQTNRGASNLITGSPTKHPHTVGSLGAHQNSQNVSNHCIPSQLDLAISSFTPPHQKLFNNLAEINAIQLNLLVADSALGMMKDHNFESCTICVCNMSIRGSQPDALPTKGEPTSQWRLSVSSENLMSSQSNLPSGEYNGECTCGFSALLNRHSSHLAGLFFEDELELTNVLYDPNESLDHNKIYRKLRLSTYNDQAYNEEHKFLQKLCTEMGKTNKEDTTRPGLISSNKYYNKDEQILETTKIFTIEQIKQTCTTVLHPNSSLYKLVLVESFRNNRCLTSCTNYYAQATSRASHNNPFNRLNDDASKYTNVKMMNKNAISLIFSDFCELSKTIITKLNTQKNAGTKMASKVGAPVHPTGLSSIFTRMISPSRQTALTGKGGETHANSRSSIIVQGLQALVTPTLSVDPKGALQLLEYLMKDESKEALATLNKAIMIFSSPMHDWQFLSAPIPENNFDVANLLKVIQPFLNEAIGEHNKLYKDYVHQQQQHIFSSRDSPTGAPVQPTPPCQGPLTWRQFHQGAGRGTEDQCEPQPIPSLLVGHAVEKNHLALSPFALKFWDKLLLEPYAPGHNLYYLVIMPDNPNLINHVNIYFKELSNIYDLMKLGKHVPIGSGIVTASSNADDSSPEPQLDNWFAKLKDISDNDFTSSVTSKLRNYANKLNANLAKTIIEFMDERQPRYDPHADRFESSPSVAAAQAQQASMRPAVATTMPNKHTTHLQAPIQQQQRATSPSGSLLGGGLQQDPSGSTTGYPSDPQASSSESAANLAKSLLGHSMHGGADDNTQQEDEASKQPGIVIYMIDPFSLPTTNQNIKILATIGLCRCYSLLVEQLPENLQRLTQLQLISIDSIVGHSRPFMDLSRVDQLKSLSMNIYSRCRRILTNQATAKSLTGFGTAAALEAFFRTKDSKLSISRMYTPPYILAPMKDKQTELGEMFGERREKSSVLFCSYCITEDQRWLLASVTNDKGELSETSVINIDVIDRMKRPKASVKKPALSRLMDFILSVMSEWQNPWRIIIGKMGRVGHGELKEWASLMSKRSLLNYSRQLNERCRQCSILPPNETVSILSACLVSLEPDSKLRIMPDQFTSDDRQASFNKCPLSTPDDATATHILVFPTSASIQSSHGQVEDPLAGSGLDDDLLNQFPLDEGMEDLGVEENLGMDDLFSAWDDGPSNANNLHSHHDIMSSNTMQSGSVSDNPNTQDEALQLLQQPLALGYYISTAKIGPMPNWFWSNSPHLRNSCPVFLKSALHIHLPCVQLPDDILHSGAGQSRKSHQLDSNLTTDVLRYVLEGYNSLSWLSLNPKTYDRQSCLPVHMQNLLQLYHLMESFS